MNSPKSQVPKNLLKGEVGTHPMNKNHSMTFPLQNINRRFFIKHMSNYYKSPRSHQRTKAVHSCFPSESSTFKAHAGMAISFCSQGSHVPQPRGLGALCGYQRTCPRIHPLPPHPSTPSQPPNTHPKPPPLPQNQRHLPQSKNPDPHSDRSRYHIPTNKPRPMCST